MTIKNDFIRVTSVLYPFSGLNKIDPVVVKNAAERGSRVHEICEALINDLGLLDLDPPLCGYIKSFEQWKEGKIFIPKPERFYCYKYMITGECDTIYLDGQDLVLVDLKTPLRESKTWPLQCSAYGYLARQAGYEIKRVEVIKLSREGKYPMVYQYEENLDMFLKCLEIYKYFFNNEKEEDFLQDI
jgi:hypothetical protein